MAFNGVHFSAPESGVKFVAAYLGDAPSFLFDGFSTEKAKGCRANARSWDFV